MEANLAALRALLAQTAEQRPATPDEQSLYARWSGWGAIPQVFDERPKFAGRFASQRAELRELLGPDGYRDARATTLNAHYTDAGYVQAIWKAVSELGFGGGQVLEPGCGSGNFLGLAPDGAQAIGVEVDPTTAAMAQALYPDARIRSESFAHTRFPSGAFDLVVGNVPFGSHKLRDPEHNPGKRHPIHNHFILKSLRMTRPGGLVAVITSRYTLDGTDNAHRRARAEMGELADLVGAVRLPTDAHQKAAGTDVVTDLLVLRRRTDDAEREAVGWQDTRSTELPGMRDRGVPATFDVNAYFHEHPEMVLGGMVAEAGQFGPTLAVRRDGPTAPALGEALNGLVAAARADGLTMTPSDPTREAPQAVLDEAADQEDVFVELANGRFAQIRDGRPVPHEPPRPHARELGALIGLRETAVALLDEEGAHHEHTPRMAELRARLNTLYDQYHARYGPVNRFSVTEQTRIDKKTGDVVRTEIHKHPPMGGFRNDRFFAYVLALERFDEETQAATKQDIFTRRVVAPPSPVERADSPDDALVVCWDLHNEVRLDEIARLLGLDGEEQARQALGTLVYDEPGTEQLIRKAEYLSGNVRRKLVAAEAAAADDPRFAVNVEALRAVVPRDLAAGEIGARLGSPWIDPSYVQQFLREVLEDSTIAVSCVGARWSVAGGDRHGVLARTTWGTKERTAMELADRLLNSQQIEIAKAVKRDGQEVAVKDPEETAIAQAKAQQLDARFRAWLWEDPDRAHDLGRIYNDRFNSFVPQSFDGERISAPGMSLAFELRPHQMAAVARMRHTGGVGLFHGTGAGKTLEMIVGGMELVRLGLARKPCYVVPKGVIDQFRREFQQAYPQADVLAVDSEDLAGDKLERFVGQCSTRNPDAIIISHTAFKRIPVSKKLRVAYLNDRKDRLQAYLGNADGADKHTVKQIEKQLAALNEKIGELLGTPSDLATSFERLGSTYLFVDEAHVYKNLMVLSANRELAHPGNEITTDLAMKLHYLREEFGPRVVTLATATPIDNAPSEILTMAKYAAPELLQQMGIEEDDQFHATFIQPQRRLEMKPDGSGFASRMRHTLYVNLQELKRLMYSFADVKLKEHLDLDEPEIVGGEPEILSVPASERLRRYLGGLAERARAITGGKPELRENRDGELKQDNILWISIDGRMGSLDMRLVGQRTDEPQKIDVVADRIAELWREHKDDVYHRSDGAPEPLRGSLQLVFCDLGVPKKGKWNVYEALRGELVARGMPAAQIRFAQDARNRKQKDQLQRDAREGKVAVLIGSRAGLGTGVNLQRRAVAVVQVDPTWKLTPLVQSLGRALRQGNLNKAIRHIIVVTAGSYDPFLWQKVDAKSRFTRQVLDPNDTSRTLDASVVEDDNGRIDPAVMFAVAAGRPELLEYHRLEEAVAALKLERRIWYGEQFTYKSTIEQNRRSIATLRDRIAVIDAAAARRRDTRGHAFAMILDGVRFDSRPDAGEALIGRLGTAADELGQRRRLTLALGELGSFELLAELERRDEGDVAIVLRLRDLPEGDVLVADDRLHGLDTTGLIRQLEYRLTVIDALRDRAVGSIERLEVNIVQAEERIGEVFAQQEDLDRLEAQFDELKAALEAVDAGPAAAEADAEAGAEVPPDLLEPFHDAVAELEATALADAELLDAARVNSLEDFALVARDWVEGQVTAMSDAETRRDFVRAYFDSEVGAQVDNHLVPRIWGQREAYASREDVQRALERVLGSRIPVTHERPIAVFDQLRSDTGFLDFDGASRVEKPQSYLRVAELARQLGQLTSSPTSEHANALTARAEQRARYLDSARRPPLAAAAVDAELSELQELTNAGFPSPPVSNGGATRAGEARGAADDPDRRVVHSTPRPRVTVEIS